jgi:hypothetical protein
MPLAHCCVFLAALAGLAAGLEFGLAAGLELAIVSR